MQFGEEITQPDNDARLLAHTIDCAILGNYHLFPVNFLAYADWTERDTALNVPLAETLFTASEVAAARAEWQRRLGACPAEERAWLITQYATPVRNQYQLRAETAA